VLLVLGCALAPVSLVAVWTHNQVSDTDRFVETVGPLIADPSVQQALTDRVTSTVFQYVDVEALGGWLGRELARWQWLTGRPRGLCSAGFPSGCATSVAMVSVLRLQLPPVDPCMRFSRTRLTDVLHRRCSV
jgi:hypothetical protein